MHARINFYRHVSLGNVGIMCVEEELTEIVMNCHVYLLLGHGVNHLLGVNRLGLELLRLHWVHHLRIHVLGVRVFGVHVLLRDHVVHHCVLTRQRRV